MYGWLLAVWIPTPMCTWLQRLMPMVGYLGSSTPYVLIIVGVEIVVNKGS